MELNKRIPFEDGYRHLEGNSAAHIKASLMGCCVGVPLEKGELLLGTWQGIYLCEFDGPRTRRVHVKVHEGPFRLSELRLSAGNAMERAVRPRKRRRR
jgi:secondary thiamine-phosphate synthase enzyme